MIDNAIALPRPGSKDCANRCSEVLKKIGFTHVFRPGALEKQAKQKVNVIKLKTEDDINKFIQEYRLELKDYQKPETYIYESQQTLEQ